MATPATAPSWSALRRRAAASLVTVATLVGIAATLFAIFDADERAALAEIGDSVTMHRLLDETLRLTIDGETAQRGFVLTADARFLGPLVSARAELPEHLDAIGGMLASKHEDAAAQALREAVEARARRTEETVALAEQGHLDEARARIATGVGMRLTDRVRALAREIEAREDQHVAVMRARVERSRRNLQLAFLALTATTLLSLAMLGTALRREIRRLHARSRDAEEGERRFRAIAESATDLVRIHARDGSVEYVSPSSVRLLGYTPEEIVARPAFSLLPEADRPRVKALLDRMFATGEDAEPIRHGLVRRDGSVRTFETRIDLARDEDGRIVRYHTIGRDITERATEEERLTARATRDALTELLNAGAFAEEGAALLARCENDGRLALLAFCDVNGLKVINDHLGHDAGDGVIVDAAKLLRSVARESDLVARLGGDEFAVLGVVPDASSAEAFARRLDERVRAHNIREDRAYRVSISLGTALFRPGEHTGLDELRAEADAAMYRNKKTRRGEGVTASGEMLVRPPIASGRDD